MAKDPAFLFYPADFLTGCADLTMEERGQYITLLCLQHQKGHLTTKMIQLCCGNAAADVLHKFSIDENGCYYNERLELEIAKRVQHSEKQRNRAIDGWKKRKDNQSHGIATALPLENENINVDVNTTNKSAEEIFKLACAHITEQKQFWLYCYKITRIPEPELRQKWAAFAELREVVEDFKTAKELKEHFINWLKKQPVTNTNPLRQPVKKQLR